ncbi:hypothetical protein EX30DRAFT_359802 [Ascodesmis nigricans]|uniref:Altered inheritance of mitochondria protein 6 n=1 Tax=Ascodesmis nigricans TaxID=341454 RepID=A0A4S2MMY0_9PEZI|nr:hypothetical protein EX30DRAFT_359802 [Ascodesmis nigricans]
MRLPTVTLSFTLFTLTGVLGAPATSHHDHHPHTPAPLQAVLSRWSSDPRSRYPTDLTRDISPKPLHSHNDYWRRVPLLTGLSTGAISTEADIWLSPDSSLLIGHHPSSLTPNRTLNTLYLTPLLEILDTMNPPTPSPPETPNGVFDSAPGQTLYLFLDLKSTSPLLFPLVLDALKPLRENDYLSYYANGAYHRRPVTVIGTGAMPMDKVVEMHPRYVFYDFPLDRLVREPELEVEKGVVGMASTSLRMVVGEVRGVEGMDKEQVETVRALVGEARKRGWGVRFWDTPGWPGSRRRGVWRQLVEAGVRLVSVDEVEEAAWEL